MLIAIFGLPFDTKMMLNVVFVPPASHLMTAGGASGASWGGLEEAEEPKGDFLRFWGGSWAAPWWPICTFTM